LSFVYTKKGKKQIVVTGEMNENYIIIEKGVNPNDEVYLSIPEKPETFELIGKELIPIIKEKIRNKKLEDEKLKIQQTEEMNPRNANFGKMKFNKDDSKKQAITVVTTGTSDKKETK
jgi:hypothetical protein